MYICKILFTLHLIYDIMLIINIYGGLSMQYKIEGGSLPIVEVSLENGESIITQGGGMAEIKLLWRKRIRLLRSSAVNTTISFWKRLG